MSKKKNKDSEGTKDEKYENLLEFVTSYESRADRLKTALAPLMKTGFLDLVKSVKEGLQNKHTKLNKELTEKQETITSLEEKVATETWLETEQIPFDRLLFDRPKSPIYVEETPPNAKYHKGVGDNDIIAMLFDEWKEGLC